MGVKPAKQYNKNCRAHLNISETKKQANTKLIFGNGFQNMFILKIRSV
jgi:hypothetical protein